MAVLPCLLLAAATAVSGDVVSWSASGSPLEIDSWFGFNVGDHAATKGPWAQKGFNEAVRALRPSTLRFPAGTAANYWDWKQGCEKSHSELLAFSAGSECKGKGLSKLEDFAATATAAGAEVVFVLNMLTDTLDSQIEFLTHAQSLGLKVRYVELGNEFYNAHADYVKAFPTGTDYGKEATTWMTALRKSFPDIAISVVGVPSYREEAGNKKRLDEWNELMFAELTVARKGDGVTMHEYDPTGVSGSTFSASDLSTMLSTPFTTVARVASAGQSMPSWASLWITEYNLFYNPKEHPDVPAYGTWAHGLYLATETILFVNTPRIASGRVCRHCLLAAADDGALFEDTSSFDFDLSPDKSLKTELFGPSAAGIALSLFGNASLGSTSAAALSFAPNPTLQPGNYPSLVGALFSGPKGARAIVVNLAASAVELGRSGGSFGFFEQVSADDATTPVNSAGKLKFQSGPASGQISLPAFSVTHLFGTGAGMEVFA